MELACALSKLFVIKASRIYTEHAAYCSQRSPLISPLSSLNEIFTRTPVNSLYPYMYYVLPDLAAAQDLTNLQIRESISDKKFNII